MRFNVRTVNGCSARRNVRVYNRCLTNDAYIFSLYSWIITYIYIYTVEQNSIYSELFSLYVTFVKTEWLSSLPFIAGDDQLQPLNYPTILRLLFRPFLIHTFYRLLWTYAITCYWAPRHKRNKVMLAWSTSVIYWLIWQLSHFSKLFMFSYPISNPIACEETGRLKIYHFFSITEKQRFNWGNKSWQKCT